jgi:hypothetical protein
MEKNTQGAWIIHHTDKLIGVTSQNDFENLYFSGKCGMLLSALAESDNQSLIQKTKVDAIAKASGVNLKLELPIILDKLYEEKLIDKSISGDISVLGLTTNTVLQHTSKLFEELKPSPHEKAVIEIAELSSENPKIKSNVSEYICDSYRLPKADVEDLLFQTEQIGFIDSEEIDNNQKLYFNGNLFRNTDANKINKVLSSLVPDEQNKISQLNSLLDSSGCVPYKSALRIMGDKLLEKVQSIGLFDLNTVSNGKEVTYFITKPSSFSKYGNPLVEDALDLAKAFVASLSYGMIYSTTSRGKISMLSALLNRLIKGQWVGPATAIGQDYQILEYKRVVEIKPDKEYPGRFNMRLLKKDVGEIALKVLNFGNASEDILLHGSKILNYEKPEKNREIVRKRQTKDSKRAMIDTLRTLRNEL